MLIFYSFGFWILHLPFYLCLKHIGIQFLNNSFSFCSLCSDISCPFFHSFFPLSLWKKSGSVNCSILTLCDTMECCLPGSSGHGILQARILEWVAMPFSRGSFWPRDQTQVSCIVGRFFTIWAKLAGAIFYHYRLVLFVLCCHVNGTIQYVSFIFAFFYSI